MSGYSLNKNYTRLIVWHFNEAGQLVSTLTYRYKPNGAKLSRGERYAMFCKYIQDNGLTAPEMEATK